MYSDYHNPHLSFIYFLFSFCILIMTWTLLHPYSTNYQFYAHILFWGLWRNWATIKIFVIIAIPSRFQPTILVICAFLTYFSISNTFFLHKSTYIKFFFLIWHSDFRISYDYSFCNLGTFFAVDTSLDPAIFC